MTSNFYLSNNLQANQMKNYKFPRTVVPDQNVIPNIRKNTAPVFLSILMLVFSCLQIMAGPGFLKSKDLFGTRCFIENKGQFDGHLTNGTKVLYALQNGDERIYFTPQGPVYKFVKNEPLKEWQREAMEQGKK